MKKVWFCVNCKAEEAEIKPDVAEVFTEIFKGVMPVEHKRICPKCSGEMFLVEDKRENK